MTAPNASLHSILVAHVLSEFLVSQTAKSDTVEIPLSTFMTKLNAVVISYNKIFHNPANYAINVESLKHVLETTSLSKVVSPASLDDGVLQIQASPFQEVVTEVVVESTIKHGNELISELNRLKERYHSDEPDPVPEPVPEPEDAAGEATTSLPAESQLAAVESAEPEPRPSPPPDAEESAYASPTSPEATHAEPDPAEGDSPMEIDQQTLEEAAEQAAEEERQNAFVNDALVDAEDLQEDADVQDEADGEAGAEEPEPQQPETEATPDAGDEPAENESEEESDDESLPRRSTRSATPSAETKPKEIAKPVLHEPPTPSKRSASPLSATHKQKRFQTIAVNLIKSIEGHRYSSPFLTAVTADDYKDVVYDPKDLKSIMKAVKQKENSPYQSVKDLERDVMLMFANCVMFNKSSTPLVEMAREMKEGVQNTFRMFEDAEADMK